MWPELLIEAAALAHEGDFERARLMLQREPEEQLARGACPHCWLGGLKENEATWIHQAAIRLEDWLMGREIRNSEEEAQLIAFELVAD